MDCRFKRKQKKTKKTPQKQKANKTKRITESPETLFLTYSEVYFDILKTYPVLV